MRAQSGNYGPADDSLPPPARTHSDFVQAGLDNEVHVRTMRTNPVAARQKKMFLYNQPYKTSGVKEASPLRFLPFFNLVWDVLPDMMHIISGIWKRHIFAVLLGKRMPADVKVRVENTKEEQARMATENITGLPDLSVKEAAFLLQERNIQLLEDHEACKNELRAWTLSKGHRYANILAKYANILDTYANIFGILANILRLCDKC